MDALILLKQMELRVRRLQAADRILGELADPVGGKQVVTEGLLSDRGPGLDVGVHLGSLLDDAIESAPRAHPVSLRIPVKMVADDLQAVNPVPFLAHRICPTLQSAAECPATQLAGELVRRGIHGRSV